MMTSTGIFKVILNTKLHNEQTVMRRDMDIFGMADQCGGYVPRQETILS